MEDVETKVLDDPLPSPTAPPAGWDRLRAECPVAHTRFLGEVAGTVPTEGFD